MINPYLLKITDNVKLISTILFTDRFNTLMMEIRTYRLNEIIELILLKK